MRTCSRLLRQRRRLVVHASLLLLRLRLLRLPLRRLLRLRKLLLKRLRLSNISIENLMRWGVAKSNAPLVFSQIGISLLSFRENPLDVCWILFIFAA
jgi:hypothetical protein